MRIKGGSFCASVLAGLGGGSGDDLPGGRGQLRVAKVEVKAKREVALSCMGFMG